MKGTKMTRLDQARERLSSALARVEEAAGPLAGMRKSSADAEGRLAEVLAERERLLLRIAELEEEAQVLSGLTSEVENRLDGAIAEIRTALGR
jgi:hypothetical protein